MVYTTLLVFCFLGISSLFGETFVVQSARDVPLAQEVDLLVIGGSTGGVAAAWEAARKGADVLLITPYPYPGEDRTATLRLSGESGEDRDDPLFQTLQNDPNRSSLPAEFSGLLAAEGKHPFTYRIREPIAASHPEIPAPGRLADGVLGTPVNDSLQVDSDAVILVDLGGEKPVGQLTLMAFERTTVNPFQIGSVSLDYSHDGEYWRPCDGAIARKTGVELDASEKNMMVPFTGIFRTPLKTRHLRLTVKRAENMSRILLSELLIFEKPVTSQSQKNTDAAPRPMHIKRTLDRLLLEAEVPFLFNTFASGEILDSNGKSVGMMITNRSGRQAVLAKRILYARERVTSLETAEFTVIGGKPREIDLAKYPLLKAVRYEVTGQSFSGPAIPPQKLYGNGDQEERPQTPATGVIDYPVINYHFTVAMPPGTSPDDLAFRAELETQIRLATFSPEQAFTADELYFPQTFEPLSVWRQKGCDLAEEAVQETADSSPPYRTVIRMPPFVAGQVLVPGRIREVLTGIRSELQGFDPQGRTIQESQRVLPVLADYDVVVVGGGTSGAPAGIAAGRQGAKTLVLEHLHDLGGIGTAGAISNYWYGNQTGFTKEVQAGLASWSIEGKIHWWRKSLHDAHADVWHGVLATGALTVGNHVRGVLVTTPFGPGIVTAKVVIDATGNADIAVAAGAKIQSFENQEIAVQGAGLAPRTLGGSYANTDFMFVDETDILDSSHVFVYAKEKYPHAFDQGKLLSTRERRQILGDVTFTALDQINGRTYPDTIMYGYSDYDTHGYTIDPYMELNHPHPNKYYGYVPYRSSLPQGVEGILVSGLAMSCHRDALPIVRMQPDLQNQGYALGCAAAMLVRDHIDSVRKLDVRELQRHLIAIGNLKPETAVHEDNYGKTLPQLPAAVKNLGGNFKENAALVAWYPKESAPLVRQAYLDAADFEEKLLYANMAAYFGDTVGVPVLLKKLDSYEQWDKGWNFRGMGQAGNASSPMDRWITTLGRLKDRRALTSITAKAKLLTHESDFSHFRAVTLALENIGGSEAAETLAFLLKQPHMTGYVHDTLEKATQFDKQAPGGTNQEKARRDSLIEISLARALYHCGDADGLGKSILTGYTKDFRGYFARHAEETLKK
jgi:ribulose 1,5-bisphosphate synthetase/thiazole synthase